MRSEWHGDRRDLVKWSTIADLVPRHSVERLIYVPFLRGEECPAEVHPTVWKFYRTVRDIERLTSSLGIQVEIVEGHFDRSTRGPYLLEAISLLQRSDPKNRMVFLDPDTGLREKNVKAEHVSVAELQAVWHELDRPGDLLVLYQHSWRDKKWLELAERRFREHLPDAHVWFEHRPKVASDVVFLVAERVEASGPTIR
ncbi:MAG: hypothetical protein K8J08_02815 [Thermoanaerobaculia bacterium]|nr:hypothetical protein [Thermoanaerobaculia bacterium]